MGKTGVDYSSNRIDDAYHGTLSENVNTIIKERKFIPTKGDDSYLGDGIYFYEGSRWLAAKWVTRKNGNDAIIGIICATVNYGVCLNLNIPEHRNIIRKVKERISQREDIRSRGIRVTDALVINYYATNINKAIDTIRLTYISTIKGKIYNGSIINDYMQPMLCVRNQDKITNIKLSFQGRDYRD